MVTFGIVGAGNMGSAILRGALSANVMSPEHVWISNPHCDKMAPFGDMGVHTTASNTEVAKHVDILLLAVKPQRISDVLDEIAPFISGKCVVSIAAGISRSWLKQRLPGAYVICVMPNTPLMLGCGASAMTEQDDVPDAMYHFVTQLFRATGTVCVLPEDKLNEIIPVNGSSPAFFFRMARLMVDAAQRRGIDADTALTLIAKTMEGAALMLQSSGKSADELESQVCSPGGTTLAALTAFDELNYAQMIELAFERCIRRAIELGK